MHECVFIKQWRRVTVHATPCQPTVATVKCRQVRGPSSGGAPCETQTQTMPRCAVSARSPLLLVAITVVASWACSTFASPIPAVAPPSPDQPFVMYSLRASGAEELQAHLHATVLRLANRSGVAAAPGSGVGRSSVRDLPAQAPLPFADSDVSLSVGDNIPSHVTAVDLWMRSKTVRAVLGPVRWGM